MYYYFCSSLRLLFSLPMPLFYPVPFRRRLCCFLRPHQVNYRLLPPPHPNLCPRIITRCLIEVQKRARCNILYEHILTSTNVGFHRLKPRLYSCRLRRGVLPPSIQPPQCQTPCQSPWYLVLETHQDASNARDNHPHLCTEEQHQLENGFKEKSEHPRPRPLPSQDPRYYLPNFLRLGQVLYHRRTVIIHLR